MCCKFPTLVAGLVVAAAGVSAVTIFAGAENASAQSQPKASAPASGLLAVGADAPDWNLQDPAGNVVSLRNLKGGVVVLDFWATWCGPCIKAMPTVQKIHEAFKDNKNVHVFGVNVWENADAPKFMKDKKFTYGLLMRGDDVAKAYGVKGIPAFFVIGPDGKVLFSETGFNVSEANAFEKKITGLIEKALATKGG